MLNFETNIVMLWVPPLLRWAIWYLAPSSGLKIKSIYLVVLNSFNIATKNIAILHHHPPPTASCLVPSVQHHRDLNCVVECFHSGTKIDPRVKTHRDIRPKCSLSHSDSKGFFVWQGGSCAVQDARESVSVLWSCFCFHFQMRVSVFPQQMAFINRHSWWNPIPRHSKREIIMQMGC